MSGEHADAFCATVVLLGSFFDLTSLAHESDDCDQATPAHLSRSHRLFRVVLDVVALELDELVKPKPTQRLSSSRILPSDPSKILRVLVGFHSSTCFTYWCGVVTAVHEYGASFDVIDEFVPFADVLGPDTGCQAELAVIHQLDGLCIILDLHDWNNWAEGLLGHNGHVMSHSRQEGWSYVVTTCRWVFERVVIRGSVGGSFCQCVLDVGLDSLC